MSKALARSSSTGFLAALIPLILLISAPIQAADKAEADAPTGKSMDGVPIVTVIDAVAKRTKKRYLVDPRVQGTVAKEGLDLNKIDYRELQAILRLHGFAAVEIGGAINVVPDANVRSLPLPVIEKDSSNLGDDDVVIKMIQTGKLDATRLVPLLRPMLPQYAHFAASSDFNSLIVVARYANIKTIEQIVRTLEKQPMTPRLPGSSTPAAVNEGRP
jgi:general secretion pathway protein D